jgi:DGQHR domain-containing protein
MKQKAQTLYLFAMNSEVLSQIAYVTPRSQEDPDEIQRLVNPARAKDIGRYIQEDLSLFPNALVVSLDGEVEVQQIGAGDEVTLVFPESEGKFAYILDGQHRLAGFQYSEGIQFDLPVVALPKANESLRGKIFADINSKQVKVSDVHLLDLYYGLGVLPAEDDATVKVVKMLGEQEDSPLEGKIKFLDDQTGAWVKNTAVTKWLGAHTKTGGALSNKTPGEQAMIFKEYFRGVESTWPEAWGNRKDYALCKPFGLEVIAGIFRAVKHRVDLNGGRQYTGDNFRDQLLVLTTAEIKPFGGVDNISIPLTWEVGPMGPLSNASGRSLIIRQLVHTLQEADE